MSGRRSTKFLPVVDDGDGVDQPPFDLHCGGADAAERDDALAGDPEVVVREEAAPFAAQTLGEGRAVEEHGRERRRHREQRHQPALRRRSHGRLLLLLVA
uniref:Uncharacterized protein n=1 Tax=Arundo donax TaxID=35708 RepID=A0A0A9DBK0_ARUDO